MTQIISWLIINRIVWQQYKVYMAFMTIMIFFIDIADQYHVHHAMMLEQ
jgi:hypothetical protein